MIKIDDLQKINLLVGEVKKIEKNKIIINNGEKDFEVVQEIKANVGDKLVISSTENKIVILVTESGSILSPEKGIENGSKVM
jgi:hypothetical protein